MRVLRTVLVTSAGAATLIAAVLGPAPDAAGQDFCAHASVDDGLVTTTIREGDCPPVPPVDEDNACPGGAGVYGDGDLPKEHQFMVCVF